MTSQPTSEKQNVLPYGSFTVEEMKTAFNLVANKMNWKEEINEVIELTSNELMYVNTIMAGVVWFSGCQADWNVIETYEDAETGLTVFRIRFKAAGYYRSIGA